MTKIKPGDRVSATLYGETKTGTVTRVGRSGSIVFVRWDGAKGERWTHVSSLSILP